MDPVRGYGIAGDRFDVIDALGGFGHESWFRLGDRDFATSQHRTLRLREGARLSQVTDEIAVHFGLTTRILPMSDDPCATIVELDGNRRVHFEEYLARDGAPDEVRGVDLSEARRAQRRRRRSRTLRIASVLALRKPRGVSAFLSNQIDGGQLLFASVWVESFEWASMHQKADHRLRSKPALRDSSFFDRVDRLAGFSIENENHSHLGRLHDDRDRLSVFI